VIGCFYDVGLREAREVSGHAIVTAPCETSTAIASSLGNTFSILVSSRKCIHKMQENVRLYGYEHRLASMRPLDIGIHEMHLNAEYTSERLLYEGRRAIEEDGAEVLILGCAAIYGFHQKMQDLLGVPVIDAVLAPFKYAEFLAELAQRFHWYPSRKWGNESPPPSEIKEWGLFNNREDFI
jgi:allantoin racemase